MRDLLHVPRHLSAEYMPFFMSRQLQAGDIKVAPQFAPQSVAFIIDGFFIVKYSYITAPLMYSHICHRLPIAIPCYILLRIFLALAFALMSWRGVVEMV